MDISGKYIKMCEKAQEIQEIKKEFNGEVRYGLIEGDYYYIPRLKSSHILEDGGIGSLDSIWLPRQDQLQEMILSFRPQIWKASSDCRTSAIKCIGDISVSYYVNKYFLLISNFYYFAEDIKDKNDKNFEFMSYTMEQLWLAFAMKEKYNKQWNNSLEQWEIIN